MQRPIDLLHNTKEQGNYKVYIYYSALLLRHGLFNLLFTVEYDMIRFPVVYYSSIDSEIRLFILPSKNEICTTDCATKRIF